MHIFLKCSVTRVSRYNSPKSPANWVLRVDFIVARFAWPLHVPNTDVTTKSNKNSECK